MNIFIIILVTFMSGVFGSALGALGSIIITAVVCLVGIVGNICGSDYNFIGEVAFGIFLGPHVSFGPACCAAAFAKRKGYLKNSKDIATPLISLRKPSVLIVGGIFATVAWFLNIAIATYIPIPMDTIALTIVIISMFARVIFSGNGIKVGLFGTIPESVKSVGGRYSVLNNEVWVPYQTRGVEHLVMGISAGGLSSYMTYQMLLLAESTGNTALIDVAVLPGWSLALICFFLNLSGLKTPVFHHICLIAGYAAKVAYMGYGSELNCLVWGVSFSIFSAYLADFLGRTFMCYGEGFVDPPSMAISVISILILGFIPKIGVFNSTPLIYWSIPILLILVEIVIAAYQEKKVNSKKNSELPHLELN